MIGMIKLNRIPDNKSYFLDPYKIESVLIYQNSSYIRTNSGEETKVSQTEEEINLLLTAFFSEIPGHPEWLKIQVLANSPL